MIRASESEKQSSGRRDFLKSAGVLVAGLTLSRAIDAEAPASAGAKPIRGVFPIGQTPFTPDNKLDLDCLASEIKFCNRGRVAGFAWPQVVSGWSTLSEKERMDGAEALLAAGKGGSTAVVIGVQSIGTDIPTSIRYAKHAAEHGADAIISLPPDKGDDQVILEYYKTIAGATELPFIVQSQGDISVDLIAEMFHQIPNMKAVKDEAGDPLSRIPQILEKTDNKLAVFSGRGVRTMLDEMRLGFSGHCPTVGLADLYQATFDLWHGGKRREAFDMFGRIQAFDTSLGANRYVLVARGIFKDTTISRPIPGLGPGPGGNVTPDDAEKQFIHQALDDFMKPYLRA
jgi:dihydrodipicolinate synthase/N-acetylneuraminate lyase